MQREKPSRYTDMQEISRQQLEASMKALIEAKRLLQLYKEQK